MTCLLAWPGDKLIATCTQISKVSTSEMSYRQVNKIILVFNISMYTMSVMEKKIIKFGVLLGSSTQQELARVPVPQFL